MCLGGRLRRFVWLMLAWLGTGLAVAQSDGMAYSSSADVAGPVLVGPPQGAREQVVREANRPFRSIAFEFKVGVEGIGFDVGTPLCRFANLRAGAQFFDHSLNPNADGLHTVGDLTLQNVQVSVDLFPFKRSSFHVSPGMTVHNDNHLFSVISVPGGASFSLGDADYVSDPSQPIYGLSRFRLGGTYAPRLTVGWGNMLPKSGSKFSVPFEVGFQYISSPSLDLHLGGNVCDNTGCGDINANDGPQNLASEVQMLNHDIAGLRFYPIVSVGLSYKIGH